MNPKHRNSLRLAEKKGICVEIGAPFHTVLDLVSRTFRRQGKEATFLDAAVRIQSFLEPAGFCRAFVARNTESRPISGVWIVWDKKRAYYLIGGHDSEQDSFGAGALALWTAIQYTANVLNLAEFDFEGSMVPSIEQFFRHFGGDLLPTYTVSWNRRRPLLGRVPGRLRRLLSPVIS